MTSHAMHPDLREDIRHLLSASGTMSGLCITAATLFSTVRNTSSDTIVDDIFVLSALIFLLCTYCLFWALRTRHQRLVRMLTRGADILFAVALTAMVSGGFIMTYTLW
jgi:glucan phosphoethanolaminetransferase (alkaline phosphatase superfamily)